MTLTKPRFLRHAPMTFVGLDRHYSMEDTKGIPDQWHEFGPTMDSVPGKQGNVGYGVCHGIDGKGGFDYLAAVEVLPPANPPAGYSVVHFPERDYAVFTHEGSVETLKQTMGAIWQDWIPKADRKADTSIGFLERYGEGFDPKTGSGDIEVWVPLTDSGAN